MASTFLRIVFVIFLAHYLSLTGALETSNQLDLKTPDLDVNPINNLPLENSQLGNRQERQGKPQDLLKGIGAVGTKLSAGAQNLFKGVEHLVVNILSGINDVNFENQGIEPITQSTPDPDEETTPIEEEETTVAPIRLTNPPKPVPVKVANANTVAPTTIFPKRRRSRPTSNPAVPANIPVGSQTTLPPQLNPVVLPAGLPGVAYILIPGYPHPVPIYHHLPPVQNLAGSNSIQNSQPIPVQAQPIKRPVESVQPVPAIVVQNSQTPALNSVQSGQPIKLSGTGTGIQNQNPNDVWVGGVQNVANKNQLLIEAPQSESITSKPVDVVPTVATVKPKVTFRAPTTRRSQFVTRRKLFVSNTAKPTYVKVVNPPFGTIIRPKEPSMNIKPLEKQPYDLRGQKPANPTIVPVGQPQWSPLPNFSQNPEPFPIETEVPEEESTTPEEVVTEESEVVDPDEEGREAKANNLNNSV